MRTRRLQLLPLVLLTAYFLLFIPANLTGARDVNLLQVFEVDEFAQYPHVLRMLTPGETPYQTARNFLIYLHYFYGYPFYLFSALALLPLKLLLGTGWQEHTQAIVAWLRQFINVLPAILAAWLMSGVQLAGDARSGWRRGLPRLGLALFLLLLPGVVVNNLWWHPDSLGLLAVALVFWFLQRDGLRFGRNFYAAAAAAGVGLGIKYLGGFFFLAVGLYLAWGWRQMRLQGGKQALRRTLERGGLFLGVMLGTFILSNPLLLLPQERAAIIAYQKLQYEQTNIGVLLKNTAPFLKFGEFPEDFRMHYGEAVFLLASLGALVAGLASPRRRLRSALILAWLIPAAWTVLSAATRRTHYFIPLVIPLYSCWALLLDSDGGGRWKRALRWAGLALLGLQAALFLRSDVQIYTRQLGREAASPALAFYRGVQEKVLPLLPPGGQVAYRDWRVYLPGDDGLRVEFNWDFATPETIRQLNPDLILLERENVELFSNPQTLEQAANPGNMAQMQEFYAAARQDALPGYRLAYEDRFGLAFIRQASP